MFCIRIFVKLKKYFCFSKKYTKTEVPWVWIGGKNDNGDIIDLTEIVNDNITAGDLITDDFLFNLEPDCVSWSYIDFKTLNETKIPVEGIQI